MMFTRPLGNSAMGGLIVALAFVTIGCPPPARLHETGVMPQFPWPPPVPTAKVQLPNGLVAVPEHDSLGAVFDRLRRQLDQVAVGWWSAYAIGTDGFALVTRMEAIEADGRPKPEPERWSTPDDWQPRHFHDLGDYLRALLLARRGHYRIIVFAVTDRPSQTSGVVLTADSARRLLAAGDDRLPASLRRVPLGVDGRCLALIYEFERPSEEDTARFVASTPVFAIDHLVLAGLWTREQLGK